MHDTLPGPFTPGGTLDHEQMNAVLDAVAYAIVPEGDINGLTAPQDCHQGIHFVAPANTSDSWPANGVALIVGPPLAGSGASRVAQHHLSASGGIRTRVAQGTVSWSPWTHPTAAIAHGTYTGSGSTRSIDTGFEPRQVTILGTGSFAGSTARYGSLTLTAAMLIAHDGSVSFTTTNLVALSNGFQLSGSTLNASGNTYRYVAMGSAA